MDWKYSIYLKKTLDTFLVQSGYIMFESKIYICCMHVKRYINTSNKVLFNILFLMTC